MEKINVEIVRMGSLYLNRQPSDVGVAYNNEFLSFGDSIVDKELQWLKDSNMLVADRCVCTNISWEQLDQMGFVFGTKIVINNKPYFCRCLRVGDKEEAPNEWDDLLDKYGDSDNLWHCDDMSFWGQETSLSWASARAVRGGFSARLWSSSRDADRFVDVGFRPVLEPLISELSDTLLGSNIKVFGSRGESIKGRLIGFDNYDLVMASDANSGFDWTIQQGKQIVINRKAIIGIKGSGE